MTRLGTAGPPAWLAACLLSLAITSCAPSANSGTAPHAGGSDARLVVVVTTTTVFADLVRQVGGDLVDVTSLVPNGADVHTFAPRPRDMERLAAARLIVMNGLGLDDWMSRLMTDAGAGTPVVRLAEDLPGATYIRSADGTPNPHLWLNVANASRYVQRIAGQLAAVDPGHAAAYAARAATYLDRLAGLDAWVRTRFAAIPAAGRRLVSFHDAFPYFAEAYGLEMVGTVVSAAGQEPSAGQVIALIEAIRSSGVRAVLAEAQFNPAIVETIAQEAGVHVVSDLYDDTLGAAPVDTYEGMIRWDADRIVEALS